MRHQQYKEAYSGNCREWRLSQPMAQSQNARREMRPKLRKRISISSSTIGSIPISNGLSRD